MKPPRFRASEASTEKGEARIISIEFSHRPTTPKELATTLEKNRRLFIPAPNHGLIINGPAPIWGYAMMVHGAHCSGWVGVHDPRLGVVIVESHVPHAQIGEVLPWPGASYE